MEKGLSDYGCFHLLLLGERVRQSWQRDRRTNTKRVFSISSTGPVKLKRQWKSLGVAALKRRTLDSSDSNSQENLPISEVCLVNSQPTDVILKVSLMVFLSHL